MPRSAANHHQLSLLNRHVMYILQQTWGQRETAVRRLAKACRAALTRCTEKEQKALSTQIPSWLNEKFIDA
eukprot:1199265-Prorocentrum_lima.AAC.1